MSEELYPHALELLRQSLGRRDATFHEHQWEAISTLVVERGRLLVVQRTGWGKSAVYFIATALLRKQSAGPTVIISPLLALMRNQVDAARGYGVRLGTINSSNNKDENAAAESALLAGELDAIIISPERLANTEFVDAVLRPIANRVGLFVIDEAHCISDWGHDFRPDYKRIVSILKFLPPNMPVLATTATANERVTNDVAAQLGENPTVLRGRLTRESLYLDSIILSKRSQRLAWLADTLPKLEGTGIIYVATTRDADLVADWLKHRGVAAEAYYGSLRGLNTYENRARRLQLEDDLLHNRLKALVATSALGMGYDKPDLAFVIHFQSPGSVISYYQQVGRAGRGIPKAYGVLLGGSEDDDIQQYFIRTAFPQESVVTQLLEQLELAEDGLTQGELERGTNGRPNKIKAAITFLAAESPAPILISEKRPIRYSRTLTDYELPHETIRRLSEAKLKEWRSMQEYLGHEGCLMQFLAGELDDHETPACGRCRNCCPEVQLSHDYAHETGLAAAEFLEHVVIEIQPRKRAGSKAEVQARFPCYQFDPLFGELAHEGGRALCRWGEAGWGEVAMKGKSNRQFDVRLVTASADLIRERWQPEPEPTWVTFVPSSLHPALVSQFAEQLAGVLDLPCVDSVKRVRENQPQKEMENTHHRCRNLDGVFAISADVKEGQTVLLVDDAFDSGWTFAVVAALLRRAGSGPVIPFAVMSTATSG
jgi:ATP-dependent DNA helicase RecQ